MLKKGDNLAKRKFIQVGENSIHYRELYSQKFKWTVKLISMRKAAVNSTLAELGPAQLSLFLLSLQKNT